jgi:hypothetical protein
MARLVDRLSAVEVEKKTFPGMYADGEGLYLHVGPTGRKSWILRYRLNGKRCDKGLGRYPVFKLAEARKLADAHRKLLAYGVAIPLKAKVGDVVVHPSPSDKGAYKANLISALQGDKMDLVAKPIPAATISVSGDHRTFAQAAFGIDEKDKDCCAAVHRAKWSAAHEKNWRNSLRDHAKPLNDIDCRNIDADTLQTLLQPLWAVKPDTGRRVRQRIEQVLDYATVKGWRSGDNPARWEGNLQHLLAADASVKKGHHEALPYAELPDFMAKLLAPL